MFIKRTIPLIICFLTGMACAIIYYIPHKTSVDIQKEINTWYIVISGFALFLGAFTLILLHYQKIKRQVPGWGYSLFMFLGLFAMLGVGIYTRIIAEGLPKKVEGDLTPFWWLFEYTYKPLMATMFSLLAFFIASAAFRAFRIRSVESGILFVAALFLIFGRISLGQFVVQQIGAIFAFPQLGEHFVAFTEWIMDVLNMAARRGVMFGVVLGMVAMSLKIIFGIERAYLGRD
jgi:hypothetical protein